MTRLRRATARPAMRTVEVLPPIDLVLVPPGDEDALAEALDGLVEGGPDVERRRGRGVERAAAYTWEASAAAHVEVYRSVL